ncbi:MAG: nuclear transport factor 2 family protein [Brachymonas sp.]|nr:nuclear transport factor 2 family protein [Brachymonas sp.]
MSQATITELYSAFAALDTQRMARCYASNATFEDEAFSLKGQAEIMGMWGMLCDAVQAKGRDQWKLMFSDVKTNGNTGSAHWEPIYLFSATGRIVHNIIDADFTFNEQGLILTHRDRFDFWRWSRQALGAPGLLLGWSPFLRSKVRQQANANLRKYLKAKGAA